MTISYSWLKDYIAIDLSPEKVSEYLTAIGLEVEGIEEVETVKGGLRGVVVGKVLTCEQHPNADRLRVTTVDIGEGEPLNVVCGAPNVAAGQLVLLATVGTTLYPLGSEEPLKLKKGKIRGEESNGMICAEDELGLGQSHDGILVLDPAKAHVGMPAAVYFGISSDYIMEIGLTPNRTDAMSHFGVARDLRAAILRDSIKAELDLPSVASFTTGNDRPVAVSVKANEACPQYLGLTLRNVQVGESPEWLKNRLLSIGLTPINNIVDITNYVLHEVGHPLHAFDADKIRGGVTVDFLAEGSKFKTLDDKDRELSASDLMICDDLGGLCIAGVFGGASSGISANTTSVFLESAWFDPVHIRKTAKRHGLSTDASFRYERGVDPHMTEYALKRAATLMVEIAGATIASPIFEHKTNDFAPREIEMTFSGINALIGQEISKEEVLEILQSLDIHVVAENGDHLKVTVPVYRWDVTRPADVIEEILRIYGFNNIEFPKNLKISVNHQEHLNPEKLRASATAHLISSGFTEIMNNSLTKVAYYEGNEDFNAAERVDMLNPLSQDLGAMRQTLLFGGLEAVAWNRNRRRNDLAMFEFGKSYRRVEGKYEETSHLALWTCGHTHSDHWQIAKRKSDFYTLKSAVEGLLKRMGVEYRLQASENKMLADGLDVVVRNKTVGFLGYVKDADLKRADIDDVVYYGELNWTALLPIMANSKIIYRELPKFPEVERDLALLVDKPTKYAELEQLATKAERKLLQSVDLFDVYEGKNLPEGKKSYGLRFTFLDAQKTLTDQQVDAAVSRIREKLESEAGATLR